MRTLSLFAISFAIFSLRPVASAQAATLYRTVDAVDVASGTAFQIAVTGVALGETASSTATITFSYSSEAKQIAAFETCHRQLLLALAKPGLYLVQAGANQCNVALATTVPAPATP